jgi:hypothetical protein
MRDSHETLVRYSLPPSYVRCTLLSSILRLQVALDVSPRPPLPPDVVQSLTDGSGPAAAAAPPLSSGTQSSTFSAPPMPAVRHWSHLSPWLQWVLLRVALLLWMAVLWVDAVLGFSPATGGSLLPSAAVALVSQHCASDRLQLAADRLCLLFELPLPPLTVLQSPGAGMRRPRMGLAWLLSLLWSFCSVSAALRLAKAALLWVIAALTSIRPVFSAGRAALQAVETVEAGPRRGQRIGMLTPQGKLALLTGAPCRIVLPTCSCDSQLSALPFHR